MTEEFKKHDVKEILLDYINNIQAYKTGVCVTTVLTYNSLGRLFPYNYNIIDCNIDMCPLYPICDNFDMLWSIVK